ncbi:MAG: hypothetical protein ACKVH8_24705, partial [Pirellulales bacterium]
KTTNSIHHLKTHFFRADYLYWDFFFGSRKTYPESTILTLAAKYIQQCKTANHLNQISILTFEFNGSSKIEKVSSYLNDRFPDIKFDSLPPYNGTLIEEENFEIIENEHACWGQVTYDPPVEESVALNTLNGLLSDSLEFCIGGNRTYDTIPEHNRLGFRCAKVFSRKY